MVNLLYVATIQTIYMVFFSVVLAGIIGVPVGLWVTITREGHICENQYVNTVLETIVNIMRSFPFIILMILILPISRYVVGTTIGSTAAIVPLALSAAPFVARVVESALLEVNEDMIEAAKALGASRKKIISSVLFPEGKASLINGLSLVIINIIGYSAMAGAIGGGGLGNVAIMYGYERYDIPIMIYSVIIIIVMVQIIQSLGNLYVRNIKQRRSQKFFYTWVIILIVGLAASPFAFIQNFSIVPKKEVVLVVGASPVPHADILNHVKPMLAKEGIDLKVVVFNDYVTPNLALQQGSIQANYFQTIPYMNAFNASHHMDMVSMGGIHVEPFGLYSKKYTSISSIPYGGSIAVPNDPSNEARALLLLQKAGLITLNSSGSSTTTQNIVVNKKNINIIPLDAAQIPRSLTSVSAAVINGNYAMAAGLNPAKDAMITDSDNVSYANIIAVMPSQEHNPAIIKLVQVLQSPAVKEWINNKYKGAVVAIPNN